MLDIREEVDVCVVGAGHAGCEAALACARNGLETVMFTVSVDSIALMPCNAIIICSQPVLAIICIGMTCTPLLTMTAVKPDVLIDSRMAICSRQPVISICV